MTKEIEDKLWREHWFLFITDISLEHGHIFVLGFMISSLILLIIIMFGILEVYRPLQRLKIFK